MSIFTGMFSCWSYQFIVLVMVAAAVVRTFEPTTNRVVRVAIHTFWTWIFKGPFIACNEHLITLLNLVCFFLFSCYPVVVVFYSQKRAKTFRRFFLLPTHAFVFVCVKSLHKNFSALKCNDDGIIIMTRLPWNTRTELAVFTAYMLHGRTQCGAPPFCASWSVSPTDLCYGNFHLQLN